MRLSEEYLKFPDKKELRFELSDSETNYNANLDFYNALKGIQHSIMYSLTQNPTPTKQIKE